MALALHNLDTLIKPYGPEIKGILDDCAFKAFLSVDNRSTLDWASQATGTQDVLIEQTSSQSSSSSGQSTREENSTDSTSQQTGKSVTGIIRTRNLVVPDDIRQLPIPEVSKVVTAYFLAPGHYPYQGTLPLSRLIGSPSEYLNRRDIAKERNFYALWPKNDNVSETAPLSSEKLDWPDDSFASLYALGFRKSGYRPTVDQSPEAQPQSSQLSTQPEKIAPESTPQSDRPSVNLDELDFGFDLEDE